MKIDQNDLIYRQAALDAIHCNITVTGRQNAELVAATMGAFADRIKALLPAQRERDIPKKPTETIDRTWGIPHKQAVCPNCDCYLGMVHFLGEGKHKVTYCESCGQAIDWEGWEQDEID